MVVTILERTKEKDKVDDKNDYWYKVKRAKDEGWCFGQFLDLNFDQKQQYDTYKTTKDFNWFFERYGQGTSFEAANITASSFTTDEYRSLIQAAKEGNEDAASILGQTLITQLKKSPDDPKFSYFKDLFESEDFWINQRSSGILQALPERFAKDKKFMLKAISSSHLLGAAYLRVASKEVQDDAEITLKAITPQIYWAMEYVSPRLRDDESFMRKAAKINPRVLSLSTPRLKEKLGKEFPAPVGGENGEDE